MKGTAYMIAFLKSIISFFIKKKVGILIATISAQAAKPIVQELLDVDNQKKAYEFVKELNSRNDITNSQKAKLFNKKMLAWAKDLKKDITLSVLNCLRELAVNALKVETNNSEQA